MFKRFFGGDDRPQVHAPSKKATEQTTTAKESLQTLADNLERRREVLAGNVVKEQDHIKLLLTNNKKPQAMQRLKKKKLLEKQIDAIDQNYNRVQEQIMQMEMASTHVDTIAALAQAAKANKAQLSENKIESVEEVLADIQEANQDMADIADALAAPTGFGMDVDEDDLEAELAGMGQELLDAELMGAPHVPATKANLPEQALPSAPTTAANIPQKSPEELELEALQREMGLEAI